MRDFMERYQAIMRIGPTRGASPFARLWWWFRQARENPQARRARRVTLMLVLLWIANGFDLVFTLLAVEVGGFVEGNPIAAPLLNDVTLLVTFKILVVAMASIIMLKFRTFRLTEIGCGGLCLIYIILSARWWIYYLQHH